MQSFGIVSGVAAALSRLTKGVAGVLAFAREYYGWHACEG